MAMGFATDDAGLRRTPASVLAERYAAAGAFPMRYWAPGLQVGAFALPRFIAELVETA
jgi:hypothetical protein